MRLEGSLLANSDQADMLGMKTRKCSSGRPERLKLGLQHFQIEYGEPIQ